MKLLTVFTFLVELCSLGNGLVARTCDNALASDKDQPNLTPGIFRLEVRNPGTRGVFFSRLSGDRNVCRSFPACLCCDSLTRRRCC